MTRDADKLESAHEDKDEQDDNNEPKAAGRIIAPAAAIGPRRESANENQDQNNQGLRGIEWAILEVENARKMGIARRFCILAEPRIRHE
jgi:hypothetical protein